MSSVFGSEHPILSGVESLGVGPDQSPVGALPALRWLAEPGPLTCLGGGLPLEPSTHARVIDPNRLPFHRCPPVYPQRTSLPEPRPPNRGFGLSALNESVGASEPRTS